MTPGKYEKIDDNGSGSVVWGGITGTLSDQADLQTELDGKEANRQIINIVSAVNVSINPIVENAIYKVDTLGNSIVITIPDSSNNANHAKFLLNTTSGDFKVVTVSSQPIGDSTEQLVSTDAKGFEVTENGVGYAVTQDSRPSSGNIAVTFYPTGDSSTLQPAFNSLATVSPTEAELVSVAITSSDSANPTSLGYWINDNKALVGDVPENEIIATGIIKLTSAFNRTVKFRFKYYKYNYETDTLEAAPILTTSYSSTVDSTEYEQKVVSGTLPADTWAIDSLVGHTLVIELEAYKDSAAGDNPTLTFLSGGATPSKTTVSVPVSSFNHNSMGGVVSANVGVPDGHINNKFPLVFPMLTTTERDAISGLEASMKIYNTTTAQFEKYDGASWVADGGGGGAWDEEIFLSSSHSPLVVLPSTYAVPELNFLMGENVKYEIEVMLNISKGGGANGPVISLLPEIIGSFSPIFNTYSDGGILKTNLLMGKAYQSGGQGYQYVVNEPTGGSNDRSVFHMKGIFQSTSIKTFQLKLGAESSSNLMYLLAGSFLRYREIV